MGDTRPHVVHLITRLELGGAQQNTLYCVAHHDRSRYRVSLWGGAGGILDAEASSIPDAEVRLLPWLVHPIRPPRDVKAAVRLTSLLRRERPDVLHTHSSKAGILGRWAASRVPGTRVVHTVHGWSFNDTQPPVVRRLFQALERRAGRYTDRIVCVSHRDWLTGESLGIGRRGAYRLIRSGIDPSEFAPRPPGRNRVRKELGVHADDILVGSVACLKPQKSPLDFVAAAEEAGRDNPRLRFVLAGDGELRTLVEAAARDSVLGERFRLLGWRRDIPDLLSALDVFVLTSRFEGLPRAVLQAMVAGVPVVATAVGGTPEVVENGTTGLLVAPDAPSEVARAVSLLGGDPALRHRLAAAARSRVDEQFDIRRMVRTLDDLYAELLSEITLVGTARERG